MIRGIVTLIRTRYDARVTIVIRLDAGFFDENNFALCDELGIGFIATGKTFKAIKEKVAALGEKEWKVGERAGICVLLASPTSASRRVFQPLAWPEGRENAERLV